MPYVLRNQEGAIKAVSQSEMTGNDWEFVDGSDKGYLAFLEHSLAQHNPFRESDIQLARVLEDLISLLVERDIIRFTDFPEAAQKRLIDRQAMRMKGRNLNIIDEARSIF